MNALRERLTRIALGLLTLAYMVYAAAADAAYAYAYAAAAAAAAADAAAKHDEILADYAERVVQILIDMKAPGCQWLFLTEAA